MKTVDVLRESRYLNKNFQKKKKKFDKLTNVKPY